MKWIKIIHSGWSSKEGNTSKELLVNLDKISCVTTYKRASFFDKDKDGERYLINFAYSEGEETLEQAVFHDKVKFERVYEKLKSHIQCTEL